MGGRRVVGVALALALTGSASVAVASCGAAKSPEQTVTVPSEYRAYFQVAAQRCPGVLTPQYLAAIAYVESRFEPDAESGNGAQGLMQILPAVFRQYGVDANGDGKRDVFTPADSIATAAELMCYLSKQVRPLGGDQVALQLSAYNAGLGAVMKYRGVPPYGETRDYVDQVKVWTERFAQQYAAPATARATAP